MKRYEALVQDKGLETLYLEYGSHPNSLQRQLAEVTDSMTSSPRKLIVAHPTDFILEKRLQRFCSQLNVACEYLPTPQFINAPHENAQYREGKKRWFMGDFYKFQRRRLNVLMDFLTSVD